MVWKVFVFCFFREGMFCFVDGHAITQAVLKLTM